MSKKKYENEGEEKNTVREGKQPDKGEEEKGWWHTCLMIVGLVVFCLLLMPYALVYNWVIEPLRTWKENKKKKSKK